MDAMQDTRGAAPLEALVEVPLPFDGSVAAKLVALSALAADVNAVNAPLDIDNDPAMLRGVITRLRGQVADLERLLEPAQYVVGPEECMEGDCEDYYDPETEARRPDVTFCAHLDQRVATFAHVLAFEGLEDLIRDLRYMVKDSSPGSAGAEVLAEIDDQVYATACLLDNFPGVSGGPAIVERKLFAAVVERSNEQLRAERAAKQA